jgi:hypothetical protein
MIQKSHSRPNIFEENSWFEGLRIHNFNLSNNRNIIASSSKTSLFK